MKYIRTKDGKIIVNDFDKTKSLKDGTFMGFRFEKFVDYKKPKLVCHCFLKKEEITKKANTIEELCDEAIFFDEDNVPHYKSKEGNIWYLGAGLFTKSLRFGIFTDKGLIFVAQLNNKGKLELLWH